MIHGWRHPLGGHLYKFSEYACAMYFGVMPGKILYYGRMNFAIKKHQAWVSINKKKYKADRKKIEKQFPKVSKSTIQPFYIDVSDRVITNRY